MRRFFVILALTIVSLPVFSDTRTVVTQQPYKSPYYMPQAYWGGDYIPPRARYKYRRYNTSMFPDINDLEQYAMNKSYVRDNDYSRLERLEMLAFGAVQTGSPEMRYNNVRNAILSRPKPSYKTSLLRNLGEYFGGQLTGYTPSVNQTENSFNTFPFGTSSVTDYSSPWGHGTSVNNYGMSSGTGIKILD